MITNTQIATTSTRIFLSSGENAITTTFFCNTSDVDDTEINIFVVPAAGTVGDGTKVISNLKLPAGETFVFDMEKIVLENSAAIWARATVSTIVTSTISSVQIS